MMTERQVVSGDLRMTGSGSDRCDLLWSVTSDGSQIALHVAATLPLPAGARVLDPPVAEAPLLDPLAKIEMLARALLIDLLRSSLRDGLPPWALLKDDPCSVDPPLWAIRMMVLPELRSAAATSLLSLLTAMGPPRSDEDALKRRTHLLGLFETCHPADPQSALPAAAPPKHRQVASGELKSGSPERCDLRWSVRKSGDSQIALHLTATLPLPAGVRVLDPPVGVSPLIDPLAKIEVQARAILVELLRPCLGAGP